ncbi:hypothetical protein SAMN02746041_02488 [Desulfacinum hydrothermale DSM 13146]|uniref:Uncharacterized protein n=1 Tax=Desulfacinum hydrothermale DSM 13146 TaxID=1121390 RepID=A0A1W1XPU5_9BACT|nr:hypothetical protein [Desulfacinum hydrothermale]SMC25989.1 hypothetical protein SAMN02746041_02488 [Desulfacinum hydrothermale DSM 13146]
MGRKKRNNPWIWGLALCLLLWGCSNGRTDEKVPLRLPRGYAPVLEFVHNGRLLHFGPFVGYYFRADAPGDMRRIRLVCFNEGKFYASDASENALLYQGDGVLTELPPAGIPISRGQERIYPIFFTTAPAAWLHTRPNPRDAYVHFHSCHDATGPVLTGYWIRHVAVRDFTYDMGGRVGPGSPLYHKVQRGPDKRFARIIEFDRGRKRP